MNDIESEIDAYVSAFDGDITDLDAAKLLIGAQSDDIEGLEKEIERLKDGLRQMVSNTAVYGEVAGEEAEALLKGTA